MGESKILFVYTTVEIEDDARRLAESAIAAREAACVQIGAPITSVYSWEPDATDGREAAIQREIEIPLLFKTTEAAWPLLEARLRSEHPYELPEIVAVDVNRGSATFFRWVDESTRS